MVSRFCLDPAPDWPEAVDLMLTEAVDPPKPPHTRLVNDLGRLSWLMKGVLFDLLVSGRLELLLADEPVESPDILAPPELLESSVSYS